MRYNANWRCKCGCVTMLSLWSFIGGITYRRHRALRTGSYHDANFVIIGNATGFRYENQKYHQWRWCWYYNNYPFRCRIATTCNAATDDKVGIMKTLCVPHYTTPLPHKILSKSFTLFSQDHSFWFPALCKTYVECTYDNNSASLKMTAWYWSNSDKLYQRWLCWRQKWNPSDPTYKPLTVWLTSTSLALCGGVHRWPVNSQKVEYGNSVLKPFHAVRSSDFRRSDYIIFKMLTWSRNYSKVERVISWDCCNLVYLVSCCSFNSNI